MTLPALSTQVPTVQSINTATKAELMVAMQHRTSMKLGT